MFSKKQATTIIFAMSCALGNVMVSGDPTLPKLSGAPIGTEKLTPTHSNTLGKADKTGNSGDGSLFSEIIPTELEQTVTVKPSWLPLSKQLASLQEATKVPVSLNSSVPDDLIFVAASSRTEFSVLHQMRLLLTDDYRRGEWVSQDLKADKHAYHLWHEAVTPKERRAKMAREAEERLARLLSLLHAGTSAWDAARQKDPDLSNGISQPVMQAPLLLAGTLSPEQLDGVLMGEPLTLQITDMSPQNQAIVRQSTGATPSDNDAMTVQDRAGRVISTFYYMRNLNTSGKIVFTSTPLPDDPGTLGLCVTVYPERDPTSGAQTGLGGSEMLHMHDSDFVPDEKQKIEARHRQEAADALAAKTPGAKTVTIDKAAQPQPGEPPLAAYLRAFAEQTKLTVLAHWPLGSKALTDAKGLPRRLPASIVNRPAAEALDILCKTYGGEWVQDEATVRLRALPAPEPAVKRGPVVPAPPASPVASPVPGK